MPHRSAQLTHRASPKMRPLQRLIGTWLTQGLTLSPSGEDADAFTFVDQYHWLPGGHFISHAVTGELGTTPLRGLEIIGYEGAALRATSYDSLGIVTHYTARLAGRDWSMTGTHERFKGRFSTDSRELQGRWERRTRTGPWRPVMQVVLTRVGD